MVVKVGDYISAPDNPSISGYDFDKWTYIIKDDEEERVVVALAASIMAGEGKINPNLHVKRIERIK
jgi:hypothetical protein